MITHNIKAGLRTRIPLDADSVQSAVLNGADLSSKYQVGAKAFTLDYADTEDLESGTLVIAYMKDGESLNTQIMLEIH